MLERREKLEPINSQGSTQLSYPVTPYFLANLAVKTGVISFSISLLTQPLQALLTRLQLPPEILASATKGGFFRSLYRGFLPYAIAGQKRGVVAVTSKETNKATEEGEKELPVHQRWAGTFLFAQADHFLSSALSSKATLEYAGIISKGNFTWSCANYWRLTKVNWGSRSLAGFTNFAALGFMGDYISSFYKFDNELYNKLSGGATSGVVATLFTTIPNSYSDRKLLASRMENNRLLTISPFTMFSQIQSQVHAVGAHRAMYNFFLRHYLKEVLVRSPQAALTFSIIFGLDHLMGQEPLSPLKKALSRRIEEIDSDKPTPSAQVLK